MRVQAFLARPEQLRLLLRDEPDGVPLTGVDPSNLASLGTIVTSGEVSTSSAAETLRTPVLSAGPRGPFIYAVPEEITEALDVTPWKAVQAWVGAHVGVTVQAQRRTLQTIFSET